MADFSAVEAYSGDMKTVHLTDTELAMVRNGMLTYLHSFGHDEADIVDQVKQVLAKLAAAEEDQDSPAKASRRL